MAKNKADIKNIDGCVVVYDETGVEIFKKPKTRQTIVIAHDIYMYHKYKNICAGD